MGWNGNDFKKVNSNYHKLLNRGGERSSTSILKVWRFFKNQNICLINLLRLVYYIRYRRNKEYYNCHNNFYVL